MVLACQLLPQGRSGDPGLRNQTLRGKTKGSLCTPKGLYSRAQGRAAAPWDYFGTGTVPSPAGMRDQVADFVRFHLVEEAVGHHGEAGLLRAAMSLTGRISVSRTVRMVTASFVREGSPAITRSSFVVKLMS